MKNIFWKAFEDYKKNRITKTKFNNVRKQYRDYLLDKSEWCEKSGEIPF